MAAWAYECQPADSSRDRLLVACLAIDAMPADTRIVRVKVAKDWLCAVVDKSKKVESAGMLLREVVASDETDCPDCVAQPVAVPTGEAAPIKAAGPSGRQVQAAAISMLGQRFVVVLVEHRSDSSHRRRRHGDRRPAATLRRRRHRADGPTR